MGLHSIQQVLSVHHLLSLWNPNWNIRNCHSASAFCHLRLAHCYFESRDRRFYAPDWILVQIVWTDTGTFTCCWDLCFHLEIRLLILYHNDRKFGIWLFFLAACAFLALNYWLAFYIMKYSIYLNKFEFLNLPGNNVKVGNFTQFEFI